MLWGMPTKRRLKMNTKIGVMKLAVPLFFAIAYGPAQGLAQSILGSSLDTFAVLGQQGVTNVPTSTIGGNLGSAPTGSVRGLPWRIDSSGLHYGSPRNNEFEGTTHSQRWGQQPRSVEFSVSEFA